MFTMSQVLLPLRGKHCLITGASSGIGAAISRRFAAEGAVVTLIGRDLGRLTSVKDSLAPSVPLSGTDKPLAHRFHQADVSRADDVKSMIREAVAGIGRLDVLVNAAGCTFGRLLPKADPENIDRVLQTNLSSAIYACSHAAPHLKATSGCIINISSILANKGLPGASVYAASKAAVIGLTKSLAVEFAPWDIRVNALVPGYIVTPMTAERHDGFSRNEEADRRKIIPLGRFGTPEEVADAAAFLAQNSYANSCILNLDGGMAAM